MTLDTYIKSFFLVVSSIYLYKKLLNIQISTKFNILVDVFFSLLLALIVYLVEKHFYSFRILVMTLFICGYVILFFPQEFKASVVTVIISIGLSYLLGVIGGSLIYFGEYLILGYAPEFFAAGVVSFVVTGIFQLLLIRVLFSFQRLKKGMPFLKNEKVADIGVVICLFVLSCTVLRTTEFSVQPIVVIVLVCSAVLLLWWLNQLQVTYRQRHSAQVEEHLEQELSRLRDENAELVQKNYELSRIIHADNKLIPALELAYQETLAAAEFADTAKEQAAQATLAYIESVGAVRNGTLAQYDVAHKSIQATGIPAVDVIVNYIAQRAAAQGVGFQFTVMGSVKYLAEHMIPEHDLSTLLADLLENALIAVKDADRKNILLSIGIADGAYILAVYDSGAAFQPDIIRRIGLERATSHGSEGGSGIGLMTTFEIIRACKASFVIDEALDNSLYTKAVSICFDGLDQTRIRSRRDEILALSQERTDISFFREQILIEGNTNAAI